MKYFCPAIPVFLLGMVLVLACGGCDDPESVCNPEVPAGRVQGYVRTGGIPIDAVIAATQIVDGAAIKSVFETVPDDEGLYTLDLPSGHYIIKLRVEGYYFVYDYAASELSYGHVPPDTVLVDGSHSPIEIDFNLGGLTLQLDLSDHLDGERGEVFLHRRDAIETGEWRSFVDHSRAEIANGRLEVQVAGILPGEYRVEIVLGRRSYLCNYPWDGEHFWMPGTRDSSESPWYEIAADSVVSLECEIATDPARIEGRILGAWLDMGLEHAPDFSIVDPDSVTIMGQHRVEDDGSFAVDIHIPGPVKLLVTHNGLRQWIGGPSFDDATIYTLQLGQSISDIEFIQSGIRLYVDAPGSIIGPMEFRFYDPTDLTLLATADIENRSNRHIALPNLWPGDFLMFVSPRMREIGSTSWTSQWFDRVTEAEQALQISIGSAGEIVPLDLILELGGVISGRVEPAEGLSGSHYIFVTPADDFNLWGYHYASAQTLEYEIQGLPEGDFKVGAYPIGQGWNWPDPLPAGTVWYPGTADWDSAGVVEIRDAVVVTDVDIEMQFWCVID